MKLFSFRRDDGIDVQYKTELQNENNLNEQFQVSLISSTSDTFLDRKLFYSFDKKKWTLNEIIFFVENNNLCLTIYNEQNINVKQYGACGETCSLQDFRINQSCFEINNKYIKINA